MASDASTSSPRLPPVSDPFVDEPARFTSARSPDADALRHRVRDDVIARCRDDPDGVEHAFAHGPLSIQATQTVYSDGFALLKSMRQGVAVAVAPASGNAPVVMAGPDQWLLSATDGAASGPRPAWVEAVAAVVDVCTPATPVDVAVASTVPPVCADAAWSALVVATARALRRLDVTSPPSPDDVATVRDDLLPSLVDRIESTSGTPWSVAPLLAAYAGQAPDFTLVDTQTREHLPVETDANEVLQWALLDPGGAQLPRADFYRRQQSDAEAALTALRDHGFPGLVAFRDLEHRDLQRAVDAVPPNLEAIVRYLVTENRRVQKHVAALRRGDWQMTGALLLMSHAAQRDRIGATTPEADALVRAVEDMTLDGFYGACMVDRGGGVLVTGRAASFVANLQTLADRIGGPLRMLRV